MVMPASSWFEHHADRAVAPFGECRPRLGEARERETVRRERLDVDEPASEEPERPRELRGAQAHRARPKDDDALARGEPAPLERPQRNAEVVGPRAFLERDVRG